ncbi:ABC transporter ATP-binding protein [Alphaproteobacteria bacterium 46_93_T64]|nr:ABC transporter ATP-binding protein [Alphaproteobacteria bacterium 46_93_T64]
MNRFIILLLIICSVLPVFAADFWLTQILSRSIILGVMALSLTFLTAYLGVVSFAQVTLAGIAGYTIAYFSANTAGIGAELPWVFAVLLALFFSTIAGALVGLIARQSVGIYSIMITLAISMAFFYFTRQNYSVFNGWTGFSGISAPSVMGLDLGAPVVFYYVCLFTGALATLFVVKFSSSPLGLSIQGVRDAARRVRAIGIPTSPVIVSAYAFSGLIAGMAGILNVWHQERVSSFSVGLGPTIDVLIISVIGGMRHPLGAFIGAITYVMIDTFAIDLISRDRFNTVIGLVLLLIVIAAPEGILGILKSVKERIKKIVLN